MNEFKRSKKKLCISKILNMKLTAIIETSKDGWYVGQIEEFPAALSQGKTIAELKRNLLDALRILIKPESVPGQ